VRNRRIYSAIGSLILLTVTALHAEARLPTDSAFKLTFDKPATKGTEAVPLGNGRFVAMEFGGTEDETPSGQRKHPLGRQSAQLYQS
jgi:glycosyl hydrolase family 65